MALLFIAFELDPDQDHRNLTALLRLWGAKEVTKSTWLIQTEFSIEQIMGAMLEGAPIGPKDRLALIDTKHMLYRNPREDLSDFLGL